MVEYLPWVDGNVLYADALNNALGYAADVEQNKITASAAASDTTFANAARYAIIKNFGSNEVFIRTDDTATTAYYQLEAGETLILDGGSTKLATLYYICNAGESTDLRVLSTY